MRRSRAREAVQPQINCISEELFDSARRRARFDRSFGAVRRGALSDQGRSRYYRQGKHFGSRLDKVTPLAKRNDILRGAVRADRIQSFRPHDDVRVRHPADHRNPCLWRDAQSLDPGMFPAARRVAPPRRLPRASSPRRMVRMARGRFASRRASAGWSASRPRATVLPADRFWGSPCPSRTVRDTANQLALVETRGADAAYPPVGRVTGPAAKRLRIGFIMDGLSGHRPSPEVRDGITSTVNLLETLGHKVEEARWPFDGAKFVEDFMLAYMAKAKATRARMTGGKAAPGPAILKGLIESVSFDVGTLGSEFSDEQVAQAYVRMAVSSGAYFDLFDRMDVLVDAGPAQTAGESRRDQRSIPFPVLLMRLNNYADYTMLQNASGGPAISLPMHWTQDNLPVGVQFASRLGGERVLLELAFELERAQPWAQRRPALGTVACLELRGIRI